MATLPSISEKVRFVTSASRKFGDDHFEILDLQSELDFVVDRQNRVGAIAEPVDLAVGRQGKAHGQDQSANLHYFSPRV